MSISIVSSTPPSTAQTSPDSGMRSAFQQLTQAIGSGDLDAAQSAYSTLSKMQGNTQGNGPFAQLMSSLGKDLASGDLSTAQSDLASFQKAHGGHHHHHKADADASTTDATTTTAATTTTSSSSSNVLDISA
jgi:hypothetical protein